MKEKIENLFEKITFLCILKFVFDINWMKIKLLLNILHLCNFIKFIIFLNNLVFKFYLKNQFYF